MQRYYFSVVSSTHRIVHSLEAKFDDDRQAEIFARGNLDAAGPPIAALEACEHTGLICARAPRVQRD